MMHVLYVLAVLWYSKSTCWAEVTSIEILPVVYFQCGYFVLPNVQHYISKITHTIQQAEHSLDCRVV